MTERDILIKKLASVSFAMFELRLFLDTHPDSTEAMAKFGMTRDQLYHYVKTYKITRTKRGKFTYLSRKELDDLLAPPTI